MCRARRGWWRRRNEPFGRRSADLTPEAMLFRGSRSQRPEASQPTPPHSTIRAQPPEDGTSGRHSGSPTHQSPHPPNSGPCGGGQPARDRHSVIDQVGEHVPGWRATENQQVQAAAPCGYFPAGHSKGDGDGGLAGAGDWPLIHSFVWQGPTGLLLCAPMELWTRRRT